MSIGANLYDTTGLTPVTPKVPGARRLQPVEIPLDNAYPTGGYSLATLAALLGWSQITNFLPTCLGPNVTAAIADFAFDKVNNKVKLFTSGGVEIANLSDASAFKLYALIEGC